MPVCMMESFFLVGFSLLVAALLFFRFSLKPADVQLKHLILALKQEVSSWKPTSILRKQGHIFTFQWENWRIWYNTRAVRARGKQCFSARSEPNQFILNLLHGENMQIPATISIEGTEIYSQSSDEWGSMEKAKRNRWGGRKINMLPLTGEVQQALC